MTCKQRSWRRSNQALSLMFLLSLPATSLVASEGLNGLPGVLVPDSAGFTSYEWPSRLQPDFTAHIAGLKAETNKKEAVQDKLSDSRVASCLANMPPLLQPICSRQILLILPSKSHHSIDFYLLVHRER